MKVYLKEEIPDRFPCFNSMKIQPVILVADEGSECVCVCMCSERDQTDSWQENPLIEIEYKSTNFWEVSEQPTAQPGLQAQGYSSWICPCTIAVRHRVLSGVKSWLHPVWLISLSALCRIKFRFFQYLYRSTTF